MLSSRPWRQSICSSSGSWIDIPDVFQLVLPLVLHSLPCCSKCYSHSKITFISLFCLEGFFFFNFLFPETICRVSLSFASVFPSRLGCTSYYRILSKGSHTISYLSPGGGPAGEFLASCILLVINVNFRGGMYRT